MSVLGVYIVVGDLLVSAFLVGLAAWLFSRKSNAEMDEIARIPLEEGDLDGGNAERKDEGGDSL